MRVASVASGVPTVVIGQFLDSLIAGNSIDLSGDGTYIVEVRDGQTIGGAVIVLGVGWAAILASGSAPTGVTPTFAVVGAAVRVSTAAGTGRTITVKLRSVCGDGLALEALPG